MRSVQQQTPMGTRTTRPGHWRRKQLTKEGRDAAKSSIKKIQPNSNLPIVGNVVKWFKELFYSNCDGIIMCSGHNDCLIVPLVKALYKISFT